MASSLDTIKMLHLVQQQLPQVLQVSTAGADARPQEGDHAETLRSMSRYVRHQKR